MGQELFIFDCVWIQYRVLVIRLSLKRKHTILYLVHIITKVKISKTCTYQTPHLRVGVFLCSFCHKTDIGFLNEVFLIHVYQQRPKGFKDSRSKRKKSFKREQLPHYNLKTYEWLTILQNWLWKLLWKNFTLYLYPTEVIYFVKHYFLPIW